MQPGDLLLGREEAAEDCFDLGEGFRIGVAGGQGAAAGEPAAFGAGEPVAQGTALHFGQEALPAGREFGEGHGEDR
jgi:hypothetical protein